MRVVAGNVSGGVATENTDTYTVVKTATGRYMITWVEPFPNPPTVVATKVWGQFDAEGGTTVDPLQNAIVDRVNAALTVICTGDEQGNLVDSNFCFIAIGPR